MLLIFAALLYEKGLIFLLPCCTKSCLFPPLLALFPFRTAMALLFLNWCVLEFERYLFLRTKAA